MMFEPFETFAATQFRIKFAAEAWEVAGAAALRRAVFCQEQGLFAHDDRDAIDDIARPIVALSTMAVLTDEVVGTVRIHETEPGTWFGSRLAVDRRYRRLGALGAALIRLAVSSAHGLGCRRFYAHVQSQNEALFQKLNWQSLAPITIMDHPHVLMRADLAAYPPLPNAVEGFHTLARRKAA